jgi:TRAP-type C4-dicarboxylate transport system substrate-binding protein
LSRCPSCKRQSAPALPPLQVGFFSFMVNDKKFQALPPDVQAAFRAAVVPAEQHYNDFVAKEQAQLLDEFKRCRSSSSPPSS